MIDNLQIKMNDLLPLREVVFETLRQAILTGELKPGERLMEIHLAQKLGVSRTPIREAIHKLEIEGLVTMIPRRGAEVANITEKSMSDVLEIRKALDALCMELACKRISDEEVAQLEIAEKDFEAAVKNKIIRDIAKADVAFHDIIVKATGNARLVALINQLSEQMYRYRLEYIKDSGRHEALIKEHRAICESLKQRDSRAGVEATDIHIDNQHMAIMEQIRLER